jgi:hypothetical protein
MAPDELGEGHRARLAAALDLLELRRLLQAAAHDEADHDEDDGEQERDPPAPGQEGLVRQAGHGEEGEVRGEHPDRHAELGEAAVERAAAGRGVLGGDEHRAAPLAADPEALQEAQEHEQPGRSDPDRRVGGQQADERRAPPVSRSVRTSIALRPMRSPKCPMTAAPRGRATKPTANVPNAASVPATEENCGKKRVPNTSAAAVPKM